MRYVSLCESLGLIHNSHQQVFDLHQLLSHFVVLSHIDLLLGSHFLHDELHLTLELNHLFDFPLLHLHVAAD